MSHAARKGSNTSLSTLISHITPTSVSSDMSRRMTRSKVYGRRWLSLISFIRLHFCDKISKKPRYTVIFKKIIPNFAFKINQSITL